MRILFIENRQQTYFWQEIAQRLIASGHDVHWLVQNHVFRPESGQVHLLPYPAAGDLRATASAALQSISGGDRNVQFFGGNDDHYSHYDERVRAFLERIRPDVVFGESTLFHELLVIRHCREMGIRYLQPSSCRYPSGRFSFYRYDTQDPEGGSGETLPAEECLRIAREVSSGTLRPDYMLFKRNPLMALAVSRKEQAKVLLGRCLGERYNTPSVASKYRLNRVQRSLKQRWAALAAARAPRPGAFQLLYPLQMQPESTIDVWGRPYRDQVALLRSLLQHTDSQTDILVKPNPKSYYEISDELLRLISSEPRLVPLPFEVRMSQLLPRVGMVVTVTGTVAIEAILQGTPVATLQKTLNNTVAGCLFLKDVSAITPAVEQVRQRRYPPIADADKIALLQLLARTSFTGLISNPCVAPESVASANLERVTSAFHRVLQQIAKPDSGQALNVSPVSASESCMPSPA